MNTPIQEILFKVRQFNPNRQMLLPFLISNRMKFQDDEKEFIKKIFKDALIDSDLSDNEKAEKAEKYYNDNFEIK